ncbi:hypothetical protein [Planctobacterium marinum]|uniref:hypothetical protein n=1 Tax=Planctobacterium marinum TaxID=1631968 RepID=UPI001E3DE2D3|nr:hypothetical protein [Planctobacterium marinum]MCC2607571.1 hypothetical protein [Planctobacterium marinum]
MTTDLFLLPVAASVCLIMALLEAWLLTAARYLKWRWVKKVFPNYRDLVRSHIDYLIMSAIIFVVFLVLLQLQINPPSLILWLTLIGAIYNPFGFILQAIKPDIVGEDTLSKVGVVIGFLPLSIGLGWCVVTILVASVYRLT